MTESSFRGVARNCGAKAFVRLQADPSGPQSKNSSEIAKNGVDVSIYWSERGTIFRRPVFSRSCCGRPGEPLNKAAVVTSGRLRDLATNNWTEPENTGDRDIITLYYIIIYIYIFLYIYIYYLRCKIAYLCANMCVLLQYYDSYMILWSDDYDSYIYHYLQPSAFRQPSSLLPVCRLQKAFVSKMSLCKSRACIKAMLV